MARAQAAAGTNQRQEKADAGGQFPAASHLPTDRALPTPTDHRRYRAHRAGQTDDEIAAADHVTPAAVRASLLRVRIDNARYSSDEAGVAVRKLLFSRLPQIGEVLDEALRATRLEGRKVIVITDGKAETLDEQIERPDHDTRLRTIDTTRALLAVVQPRDPAVQINANSQTNILNQGAQQGQLGAGGAALAGLTSPEAVIRAIRAERELRLTDGSGGSLASPKGPARLDRPLGQPAIIDAEVGAGAEDEDGDDEDDEYDEDAEEDEDEDDPASEEDDSQ